MAGVLETVGFALMDDGHKKLALRSTRVCRTPGCEQKPEPKSRLCLACQLKGLRVPKGPVVG